MERHIYVNYITLKQFYKIGRPDDLLIFRRGILKCFGFMNIVEVCVCYSKVIAQK